MGKRHDKVWMFSLARAMQKADPKTPMPLTKPQKLLPETKPKEQNVRSKIITRDVLLALVPLGIAQGYSMSGFPPTIVGAVLCWAATAALLSHAAWIGLSRVDSWIRGVGLVVLYGLISWFLWTPVKEEYIKEHSAPTAKGPSPEEREEISQLDSLFAGRDEIQLRNLYGLPEMVTLNLSMNKARLLKMDVSSYTNGREMQFEYQYDPDNLRRTPSQYETSLNNLSVVTLVVLPQAYTVNKAALLRYENSTQLPVGVVDAVKNFDRALSENADTLQRIMNIAIQEDPRYFLLYDEPTSHRFYGVVESRYWAQFGHLRPLADQIRDRIRDEMK